MTSPKQLFLLHTLILIVQCTFVRPSKNDALNFITETKNSLKNYVSTLSAAGRLGADIETVQDKTVEDSSLQIAKTTEIFVSKLEKIKNQAAVEEVDIDRCLEDTEFQINTLDSTGLSILQICLQDIVMSAKNVYESNYRQMKNLKGELDMFKDLINDCPDDDSWCVDNILSQAKRRDYLKEFVQNLDAAKATVKYLKQLVESCNVSSKLSLFDVGNYLMETITNCTMNKLS